MDHAPKGARHDAPMEIIQKPASCHICHLAGSVRPTGRSTLRGYPHTRLDRNNLPTDTFIIRKDRVWRNGRGRRPAPVLAAAPDQGVDKTPVRSLYMN
jgi:hypothetical protein